MRFLVALLACLIAAPAAWGFVDVVRPDVAFSATATAESGQAMLRETVYYSPGRLRIERGTGFAVTILDLDNWSQCLLMPDHTYLVLPMDDTLYQRYFPTVRAPGETARKTVARRGGKPMKYPFGAYGGTNPEGFYWLDDNNIMVRREYADGLFGHSSRHIEYLTNIVVADQPATLFAIPPGYRRAP